MGNFTNSEDPDEMLNNVAFHQDPVFVEVEKIFKVKNTIFFKLKPNTPRYVQSISIQRVIVGVFLAQNENVHLFSTLKQMSFLPIHVHVQM